MTPARRALLARSLFSAVHGIVVIGLEEKLQSIPLPVLREQVTVMVEAMAHGLAQDAGNENARREAGHSSAIQRRRAYRCCTGCCCGGGAFEACAGGAPGSTTTRVPTCTRL